MVAMTKKMVPLKNDIVLKKVLEDDGLLKSLLQNFLPIPKGSVVEEVQREETEKRPATVAEPLKKVFILDLKVTIRRMEEGRLMNPEIVTVEIQTTREIFFTSRLVAYGSRVYSEQLEKGEDYSKLCPVYCMAFCTTNLDVFKGRNQYYHPAGILTVDPPHQMVDDGLRFIFVELEKFAKSAKEVLDSHDGWCYLLRNSDKMEDWEFDVIKSKGDDMKQAVERLQKLSADGYTRAEIETLEKQHKIYVTEKNFAMEKGREEGMKEGIQKGKRGMALKMLADGERMDKICKYTNLTKEQVEALKKQSQGA